jgi:DNA-binding NarL/FixJ family response regulator
MKHIKIIIVDDHAVFRNALKVLISREEDFDVVCDAGTGEEALAALDEHDIDIMLLDINMPGMSGPNIARTALKRNPGLGIVMLTMHEDEYYVKDLFRIGARAFVLKKSKEDELFLAVRTVFEGGSYIDSSFVQDVAASLTGVSPEKKESRLDELTPREREICRLLAYGHTNGQIAELLAISERTVQTHRYNIMDKLSLTGRAELVEFAIEQGLFTPES